MGLWKWLYLSLDSVVDLAELSQLALRRCFSASCLDQ
jgi:hypothetical protein